MVSDVLGHGGFAGTQSRAMQFCLVGWVGIRQVFPKDMMLAKGSGEWLGAESQRKALQVKPQGKGNMTADARVPSPPFLQEVGEKTGWRDARRETEFGLGMKMKGSMAVRHIR